MNRLIVGVSGKMRSGKDTFAAYFLAKLPEFTRVGFADALKQEVADRHGITVDDINADKDTYRKELIDHGMMRREEDPDYWVKRALETPGHLIITDLRFRNEYQALAANGQTLFIRIERPIQQREQHGLVIHDTPSETELDGPDVVWDYLLCNEGSMEEFKCASELLVDAIQKHDVWQKFLRVPS